MDDATNRYAPRTLKVGDPHKDAVLLRDLEAINAMTRLELGVLPHGGLPIVPKRKPLLTLNEPPAAGTTPDDAHR